MKRGGKIFCSVAVAGLAACSTQPKLQIRPTAAPLSATQKPVPIRIAEARAQFALGNIALALESFRKAMREDPSSTDALMGVAASYDRMGRFDLSRRHYEMALAMAPADPQLLGAFAASLDLQGKREEAAAVRGEIAARLAAKRAPDPVEVVQAPVIAAPVAPVAVPVPAPKPLEVAQSVPVARVASVVPAELPRPDLNAPQPEVAALDSSPAPVHLEPVAEQPVNIEIAEAHASSATVVAEVQLQPIAKPEVGHSVTVTLPPPRPAAAVPASAPVEPELAPPPMPAELPVRVAEETVPLPDTSGPRLERLSMGVVALITTGGPIWRTQTVASNERSTTVRFVPLREANARRVKVRVLNAARVDRLAARTRTWLTRRGWSRMPIGDAPAVRDRSVIFYPAGHRELAQTLSNQFGFPMQERADAKFVTMLLGRDAARIEELRPRNA